MYETLKNAVRIRTPDADLAMGLSGGCDARTILDMLDVPGNKIHSFTYGPLNCGDVVCAKQLSEIFGTDEKIVEFDDEDLIRYAKEVVWRTDGIAEADLFFHIKITELKKQKGMYEISSVPGDAVSGKIKPDTALVIRGNKSYVLESEKKRLFGKLYDLSLKGKADFSRNGVFAESYTGKYRKAVIEDYIETCLERCQSDALIDIVFQNQLLLPTTCRSIPVMGGVVSTRLTARFPFLDYNVLDCFGEMPEKMWKGQRAYLTMIANKCPKAAAVPHYITGKPIDPDMNIRYMYLKIKDYILRKFGIRQRNTFFSDTYDFMRDIIQRDSKNFVADMIIKSHTLNEKLFLPLGREDVHKLLASARSGNERDYQKIRCRFNAAVLSEIYFD